MYIARRPFVFSCLLPALLAAGAVRAQAPDPAALQAAIAGARLDPARAVTLKNVKLGVGLGKLSLDDGVLIPATAVGGKTIEMVFLGKGRIEVEPPDRDRRRGSSSCSPAAPGWTRSSRRRCWWSGRTRRCRRCCAGRRRRRTPS